METPDTEVEIEQNVETGEILTANGINLTPDTEEKKHVAYSPEVNQIRPILVKYFNEYPADLLADLSDLLSSRDTYWKERVRKDEQGWEGYVVVDPQSNNYKCSPIFFSVKEAEKWRRDFGEPALKVETVDIILKTKHE